MDFGGNVKNPFLFDDPAAPADAGDIAVNPFLSDGGMDFSSTAYTGINPFSDQIDESTTDAMGLFGDSSAYPITMNPFGDTITDDSQMIIDPSQVMTNIFDTIPAAEETNIPNNIFDTPSAPPVRPPRPVSRPTSPVSPVSDLMGSVGVDPNQPGRPPPPRPPPPSKETKDLLSSVIGAMEATTDDIQGKLHTTRTPCPSPGNNIMNSRSPTPDIQITGPDKSPDAFSAIFGQTIDEDYEDAAGTATAAMSNQTSENQEDVDLFGTEAAKPKTTKDILSLFNKPVEPVVDLLSDDIITANESNAEAKQEINDVEVDHTNTKENAPDNINSEREDQSLQEKNNDSIPVDGTCSPEQISDMTDSELTVIESSPKNIDQSVKNAEAVDSNSSDNNKIDIDAPETISPTESRSECSNTKESPGEIESPKSPPRKESVSQDQNDIPEDDIDKSNIIEEIKPTEEESSENIKEKDDNLKETPDATIPTDVVKDDATGSPTMSDEVFGSTTVKDTTVNESNEINASAIFSDPIPDVNTESDIIKDPIQTIGDVGSEFFAAPIDSSLQSVEDTAAAIFGDMDTATPGLFSDIPETGGTSAGLFGDTDFSQTESDKNTTGFDIFRGASEANDVTTNDINSTGATLFGTTPAPNFGMSLFGGSAEPTLDIFAESDSTTLVNPFAPPTPTLPTVTQDKGAAKIATDEEFDAFSARFESVAADNDGAFDPFKSSAAPASGSASDADAWGATSNTTESSKDAFGFGDSAPFDSFLAMNEPPPVPQSTPSRRRKGSADSDETPMTVVIKPATLDTDTSTSAGGGTSPVPVLAPPPITNVSAFTDTSPRFNPFDRSAEESVEAAIPEKPTEHVTPGQFQRTDSQETPPTPLYEEDQSQPLEPFPRTTERGLSWEMHLRQPNKKKITGQRFWKKVIVKLTDSGALQLFNKADDKDPFQELPLQACYSVSDIGAQQFDQFGKIFTVKVQYIFYKERPGVRPGQISKAERITTKLSKFAQYAIAGDYEGVKEFASDVRKLGMPVEHAPQISQLLKLGSQSYEDLKIFASLIEERLFKIEVHRDRALNYKTEEVQLTAVDEIYLEQDVAGVVGTMIARVRIFFLGFLSGMPDVDLGVNDMRKQGNEIVGRHDIIPVVTEEWIRLEAVEFHNTVDVEQFEKTYQIKFKPPDACYIELMRFRVRPPKNRELPLQIKTKIIIQGRKIEIQSEIMVPGFSGRKLGQVPCEDVAVRFPLPECWIYMFRVEKHFRYGSVKSAHRRHGKVKGIERFKGTVETAEAALMEVTSGQAKYEHQHRAIVWRMPRLPKEGQGAYTQHTFNCRMFLTSFDQMPESFDKYCMVEFTMPATTVSHCVMRSVSVTSEEPPEKYVRYLARHEYKVEMEFSSGTGPAEYIAATMKTPEQLAKEEAARKQQEAVKEESSSDESS